MLDVCTWDQWAEWSECSADCGIGLRKRYRTFSPGDPQGLPCTGDCKEIDTCNSDPCQGVYQIPNCIYSY